MLYSSCFTILLVVHTDFRGFFLPKPEQTVLLVFPPQSGMLAVEIYENTNHNWAHGSQLKPKETI